MSLHVACFDPESEHVHTFCLHFGFYHHSRGLFFAARDELSSARCKAERDLFKMILDPALGKHCYQLLWGVLSSIIVYMYC